MRAAVVQLRSTLDADANLEVADRLVRRAVLEGAAVVQLPEKWPGLGVGDAVQTAAQAWDGPAVAWARRTAGELGVDLLAGSLTVRDDEGRLANVALHAGPDGTPRARYAKLHLFDVDVGATSYRESEHERAGSAVVTSELADGTGVGLSVCYDLRFPELYRALSGRGARVLSVPAAFTLPTTRDHWEVLLRARAIENQAYVLGANQHGEHAEGLVSGGRSMIVDPWGLVLGRAPDLDEAVVVADLDLGHADAVSARVPALRHRRADVAAALAGVPEGELAAAWPRVPADAATPRSAP